MEPESESTIQGLEDESRLSFTEDETGVEITMDISNDEFSRKSKSNNSRPLPADMIHNEIHPSEIIEYEWPEKSGKKYFIQEQVAQLLGVTSFKRKYPDMARRSIEPDERKYVFEELKLNMPQHLTNKMVVLEAAEVHQLMASQYPEIYSEYTKCVAIKIKNEMLEKQQALDALANDKDKLKEMREAALKFVAEYNKELNNNKSKNFYEHHTQLTFYSMNKFKKLKPEFTKPSPYPVSLLHGQYSTYYKTFTSEEMKQMPLKTILQNEKIFPYMKKGHSPPPCALSEQELQKRIDEDKAREKRMLQRQGSIQDSSNQAQKQATPLRVLASINARRQSNANAVCTVCNIGVDVDKPSLLQCSSCLNFHHPSCLEMSPKMLQVVKTYQWSCIDCKRCTVCMKPDNEDAMMCCDNCDRGYHTFCVGMTQPPTGTWICTKFCKNDTK